MATLETILGIPPEGEEKPKLEQQEAPVTQPPVQSAPPTQQPPETEKPAVQPQQTQQQGGATPPPIATPTLTQQNTGRTHMSYVEMIQQMSPYKAPTEEELAKERKKQKREAIFAAIGDGLSAFHWAYSTARGTKSMVDPRVSLSGKVRDRYDKLKKERDANKRDFDNRVQQQETQKENVTFALGTGNGTICARWSDSPTHHETGNIVAETFYSFITHTALLPV